MPILEFEVAGCSICCPGKWSILRLPPERDFLVVKYKVAAITAGEFMVQKLLQFETFEFCSPILFCFLICQSKQFGMRRFLNQTTC